jgi:hypothetical protein
MKPREHEMGKTLSTHGREIYIAIMIEECERKKLLERPRRTWKDNIKMYIVLVP